MGSGAKGIGLWEPGLVDFMGEKLLLPSQGDGIYLSIRVDLNGHQLCTFNGGELEPGIERDLAVGCLLSQQGTFS